MKKAILTASALLFGIGLSAQTVVYEIPFADMVGTELTTGDICTGFVEECKRDDNPLANQWGGTWTSTGSGIASTVDVQIQYTINDITSIPTLLNGVANNTQTAPAPFCAGSSVLTWSVDPANYNVGGSNTFLLDYSATTAICQIDNLPTTGSTDIYLIVTVTYQPCTAPSATVTSFKDVTCNGGSDGEINITPSGGTAPYTFDWDYDGTGDFDDPEDPTGLPAGTYNCVVKEAGGCTVNISQTLNEPAALDVSVSLTGGTITAAATGVTYQWVNCSGMSPISGATDQSYTPTEDGDYAVIITDGPCSDTSACTNVTGAGIGGNDPFMISIFPNPTNGQLSIVSNMEVSASVQVLDTRGRLVLDEGLLNFNEGQLNLDVSQLESGHYVLKMTTDDGIQTMKFTKY